MATDSVIDLVLFSSADGLVAMAGCHDSTLRLFSHKVSTQNFISCVYIDGYYSNRR